MKLIDTYRHIFDCYSKKQFNKEAWDRYILSISPALKRVVEDDSQSYDYVTEILPVLNDAVKQKDRLKK